MRYLTGLLTRSKKSSSLRAINVLQSKRRRRRLIVEQLEDRRLLTTFTVVNTDDSGAGSFRQAIVDANTSLGNDTIQFDSGVNGTITLTSGELAITDSLDVQGPGSNVLAISGNSSSRVFYVSANATISGLTITGGSSSNGGGIYNSGSTLTVGNCTITGNTVGIYNHGGTLTVSNSNFAGNIGSPFTTVSFLGTFDHLVGSGIYNSFGGVATVSGSRFTGNAGSGIFNHYVSGSLTTVNVSHSTFSGNQAEHGGGIYSYGGGIVQVNKSTFVHNSATGQIFSSGGGINCFVGGTLTVSNSTFSENQANYDLDGVNFSGTGGGGGAISVSLGTVTNVSNSTFFGNRSYVAGGAIFTYQATLTVTNSTLFGNTATTLAGGAIWSSGTRPTIGNTIIAGNTAPENPDVRAGVLSTGNNLIGNTSGSNGWVGSDLTGTSALPLNPMLAPLGNYGGPTQTMALLSGSPAIDAGNNALVPIGVIFDQRGSPYAHINGARVDIGAIESSVDTDGVSDALEDAGPNGGDGNGDSIPDSQQSHVTSLPNSANQQYITLASPTNTNMVGVAAISNPSPTNSPVGIEFPIGYLEFTVQNVSVGNSTTVTLYLPDDTLVNTYYKFGPTSGNVIPHWYEFLFDGTTGAEIFAGADADTDPEIIVLHFVDGQRGDDDLLANGVVHDPGSPAFRPNLAPTANAGGPYSVGEGTNLQLNGSGSSDPEDGTELIYEWDLNYDGMTFDVNATGVQPNVNFPDNFAHGTGSYGFELTAWDGQVNGGGGWDKFRIKIWNKNQGNGIVYDNMMGAADGVDPTTSLGGGSIVIHRGGNNLVLDAAGNGIQNSAPRLNDSQLSTNFADALSQWQTQGLSSTQLRELNELKVEVVDLPGNTLRLASESTN